jgi:hypothetical protein
MPPAQKVGGGGGSWGRDRAQEPPEGECLLRIDQAAKRLTGSVNDLYLNWRGERLVNVNCWRLNALWGLALCGGEDGTFGEDSNHLTPVFRGQRRGG